MDKFTPDRLNPVERDLTIRLERLEAKLTLLTRIVRDDVRARAQAGRDLAEKEHATVDDLTQCFHLEEIEELDQPERSATHTS